MKFCNMAKEKNSGDNIVEKYEELFKMVEKTKILIVVPFDLINLKAGGASRINSDLEVLSHKHTLKILFPSNHTITKQNNKNSINTEYITYKNFQKLPIIPPKIKLLLDFHTQFINPFFIYKLITEAKNCDVVIAHFPSSFFASRLWLRKKLPIFYVAHVFEYGLIKQITKNIIIKTYVKFLEKYACKKAYKILCTSTADRDVIVSAYHIDIDKIDVLPNTVSITDDIILNTTEKLEFRKKLGFEPSDFMVLYHANFGVIANKDALDFIVSRLVPVVQKRNLDMKIIIVGASIPKEHTSNEVITFYSDVPQIWPYLRISNVEIVPLRIGSGTRLKILECFHAEIPVISTEKGIEGIKYVEGIHALISTLDENEFIDKILYLKNNRDISKQLSKNAKELFIHEYSNNAIRNKYEELIGEVCK